MPKKVAGRAKSSGHRRLTRTSSWTPLSVRSWSQRLSRRWNSSTTTGEVDAADWPRVRGQDAGHSGGSGEEVGVGEDERGEAPDPTPAPGQHGRARGILDGKEQDDIAEELAGEAADAVDGIVGIESEEAGGGGDRRVRKVVLGRREQAGEERLRLFRVVVQQVGRQRHY
jgi:hypothetical protein